MPSGALIFQDEHSHGLSLHHRTLPAWHPLLVSAVLKCHLCSCRDWLTSAVHCLYGTKWAGFGRYSARETPAMPFSPWLLTVILSRNVLYLRLYTNISQDNWNFHYEENSDFFCFFVFYLMNKKKMLVILNFCIQWNLKTLVQPSNSPDWVSQPWCASGYSRPSVTPKLAAHAIRLSFL